MQGVPRVVSYVQVFFQSKPMHDVLASTVFCIPFSGVITVDCCKNCVS